MNIPVLDFTANWSPILPEAVTRWTSALAGTGISLTYERRGYSPSQCNARGDGAIHVCDTWTPVLDHFADSWQPEWRWEGSYVRLYYSPKWGADVNLALVVHELGHCLGIGHPTAGRTDTVMTPLPHLSTPTAWDVQRVAAFFAPQLPPSAPPVTPPKKKKKKKHKKKGGRH